MSFFFFLMIENNHFFFFDTFLNNVKKIRNISSAIKGNVDTPTFNTKQTDLSKKVFNKILFKDVMCVCVKTHVIFFLLILLI